MSKRHYQAIAEIIAQSKAGAGSATTEALAAVTIKMSQFFHSDNPRFNKIRFMQACGFTVSA